MHRGRLRGELQEGLCSLCQSDEGESLVLVRRSLSQLGHVLKDIAVFCCLRLERGGRKRSDRADRCRRVRCHRLRGRIMIVRQEQSFLKRQPPHRCPVHRVSCHRAQYALERRTRSLSTAATSLHASRSPTPTMLSLDLGEISSITYHRIQQVITPSQEEYTGPEQQTSILSALRNPSQSRLRGPSRARDRE